jgi:cellobiose dehydrogenase (acceptor)
MTARLPSVVATSTDGKLYLEQTANLTAQFLLNLGYSNVTINDHPNRKEKVFGYSAFSWNRGLRGGPPTTYLRTAKARPNFHFLVNTTVTSVIRNGGLASGVLTAQGSFALARGGRIILSAGAFGTACLLIQSGIGPFDQLSLVASNSQYGPLLPPQDQWINLPVGFNLSDNPGITLVYSHPNIDSYDNWANVMTTARPADVTKYRANRSGVLAMSSTRYIPVEPKHAQV